MATKARENAPAAGAWRRASGNLAFRGLQTGGGLAILQQEVEMPLFEYKCRDCGTAFEKIVATATTQVVCKQCESPRVEKLLSVFAVGGASRSKASLESGPCGACGAAQRGMCGVE